MLAAGLTLAFSSAGQAAAVLDANVSVIQNNVPLAFPQMAQTFTAQQTGQLTQVAINAGSNFFLAQTNVEIWNVANGTPSGVYMVGNSPASVAVTTPYPNLDWRTFTLNPAVPVVAGSHYAVVTRTNLNNYFRWSYSRVANYAGGRMYARTSASAAWGAPLLTTSSAFNFKTWVDTAVQNRPPALAVDHPLGITVNEGTAPTMTGTYSDPNGGTVTLRADYGQVAPQSGAAGAWTWTAPVADEGGAPSMVTLTATNTAALTTTVSFPLAVSGVVPTATITTDPPSLPEGSSLTFLGTATSPDPADQAAGFTYAWKVTKDGSPYQVSSGSSFNFSVADEGTFVISLQATDDGGMTSAPDSTTVIGAEVTPTATITGVTPVDPLLASPLIIAPSELLNFAGFFTDPAQESHSYRWDFGDGSSSATLSASHAYTASGTYTATLTVKDDEGTTGTTTRTVTVQTPQQSINLMIAYVKSLNTLNGGQQNSLIAKLNAASDSIARGNNKTAGNQMSAFLNELDTDLKTGKISSTAFNTLRAEVHAVQGAIGTYNRFLEWWPLAVA